MNRDQERRAGTIAETVVVTFLVLALGLAGLMMLAAGGIVAGMATFSTVSGSVWDQIVQIARWFALAVGYYLISTYLPLAVAHGETRRRFMVESTPFVVGAAAVLAALVTVGYALEGVLYRSQGWSQGVSADRLFSADQFGLIFLTYGMQFAVWVIAGALIGAGRYRDDGWSPLAVVLGILLILLAGVTVGLNGLPFIGRFIGFAALPFASAVAICIVGFLVGMVLTWLMVRDMPMRNRPA